MGDFAPTPGSRAGPPVLKLFATGNTTGGVSATVAAGPNLIFSAAGGLSMGISGNTILLSGNSTQGMSALGNTTGTTSSQTLALSGAVWSGGGAASVGFNGITLLVSAPATTTTANYFEPNILGNNSSTLAQPAANFFVQPIDVPNAITFDQVNFLATWNIVDTFSLTSTAATTTSTLGPAVSLSVILYTQQTGTAFNSWSTFASTTATWRIQDSISASSSSQTKSQTFFYNLGSQTRSTSFTSSSSSGTVLNSNFITACFQGFRRIDVPWASSLAPGAYLLAVGGSTVAGIRADPILAGALVGLSYVANATTYYAPMGTSTSNAGTNLFGVGLVSSVGSVVLTTMNPSQLGSVGLRPWVVFRNGGT